MPKPTIYSALTDHFISLIANYRLLTEFYRDLGDMKRDLAHLKEENVRLITQLQERTK
jgi:regulator of replication initiation timing